LSVSLENVEVLRWLAVTIYAKGIEGVVDLKNPKVLEILLDALNRQGFFHEGFPANDVCATANPAFIEFLGVDLPDPSGIPVAGSSHQNLRMQISELEFLYAPWAFKSVVGRFFHDSGTI
jgi:hypothetical protein